MRPEKDMPIKPISMREIEEASNRRVSLINREFRSGFDFIKRFPRSVTFFGSTRFKEDNPYYKQARNLAKKIVEETGYTIVTGGGPGIMEAANRGAYDVGGQSVGITIKLPHEQVTNEYVTQSKAFHYFFSRKVILTYSAEAYVFCPGGFGTMDEFFEITTLVQTNKINPVPIILVGSDYWNALKDTIKKELLARKTIDDEDMKLFTITDDENEVVDIIKNAPIREGVGHNHAHDEEAEGLLSSLEREEMVTNGGILPPFTKENAEVYLKKINDWELAKNNTRIEKRFETKDFLTALDIMEDIGMLAEETGHHPDLCIHGYNKILISLTTHDIGGISKNDFIMAAKIDKILKKFKDKK